MSSPKSPRRCMSMGQFWRICGSMRCGMEGWSIRDAGAARPKMPHTKPPFVTEAHLVFLDKLRESGITNMFGAVPYIAQAFPRLSAQEAKDTLKYWMQTFEDRHPDG